jgi:two-component system response regulator (stage 0 sporulation protein F)
MENTAVRKIAKYRALKSNNTAYQPRILLAEDDAEMRSLLALMLRKEGYHVTECPDGISLLDQLSFFFLPGQEHEEVDLIISDIRMPGVTGMEILMGAHENAGFPPIILITAFGDEKTHAQAKQFEAAAMFDKPFDIDDLLTKVRELMPI